MYYIYIMRNSFIGAAILAALSTQSSAAPAQAPVRDVSGINPNAVAKVLIDRINESVNPKNIFVTDVKADNISFVCVGNIPDGIMPKDRKGEDRFYKPLVPEIIKFAKDPDAKDKVAQENIRNLLKDPKRLAYLEYKSVGVSSADVSAYFEKTFGARPLDVYQNVSGSRDGAVINSVLLDRSTFDKFLSANMEQIKVVDAKFGQSSEWTRTYYSACGPAFKK